MALNNVISLISSWSQTWVSSYNFCVLKRRYGFNTPVPQTHDCFCIITSICFRLLRLSCRTCNNISINSLPNYNSFCKLSCYWFYNNFTTFLRFEYNKLTFTGNHFKITFFTSSHLFKFISIKPRTIYNRFRLYLFFSTVDF